MKSINKKTKRDATSKKLESFDRIENSVSGDGNYFEVAQDLPMA